MYYEPDSYYANTVDLLSIVRGRAVIRCRICKRDLRGEEKEYLDLRTWYANDGGLVMPGKGFAKPFTRNELLALGTAIIEYANKDQPCTNIEQKLKYGLAQLFKKAGRK